MAVRAASPVVKGGGAGGGKNAGNASAKRGIVCYAFLRRMYQGRFEHTAIEPFIESIGEEKYLDLEFVSDVAAQESFQIPTKNRYAMLISAVPAIYGIQDTDRQRISDYLWENIIHPLEQVLQIQFPLDF